MKFKIEIEVDVPAKEHAEKLAEAFTQLRKVLPDKDIIDLAQLITKRPGIVKQAKLFIR